MNRTIEEIANYIQDRIEGVNERISPEMNSYDREYAYGSHDAYVSILNYLGVEHNEVYHN